MADIAPPEFKPVRHPDFESNPKFDKDPALITDPLRAFYTITQPTYHKYVEQRKFLADFSEKPDITDAETKKGVLRELDSLRHDIEFFNHAERKIRGMPFNEDSAIRGMKKAREIAYERVVGSKDDPDDARAAEIELELLKGIV